MKPLTRSDVYLCIDSAMSMPSIRSKYSKSDVEACVGAFLMQNLVLVRDEGGKTYLAWESE